MGIAAQMCMFAAVSASCGSASDGSAIEMRVRRVDGPGLISMVRIGADHEVHVYPGVSSPEGEPVGYRLLGQRMVDAAGAEVMACRDGHVFERGQRVADLGEGWFAYERTRITVDDAGVGSLRRPGDDQPGGLRFIGLAPGDICTAALLFFSMPVPRAG